MNEASSRPHDRCAAVLASAPDGVVVIDARGIVESVNTSAEALLGACGVPLVGMRLDVAWPHLAPLPGGIEAVLAGRQVALELPGRFGDDGRRVMFRGTPLTDLAGRPDGACLWLHAIEEPRSDKTGSAPDRRSTRASGADRLAADLLQALQGSALQLHYQPLVDLETGVVNGIEALCRWEHPELGWIAPSHFVPLAERHGFVLDLDSWVLNEACRAFAELRGAGDLPRAARLSVNLSTQSLLDPRTAASVAKALASAGLEGTALELDVTEAGVMLAPAAAAGGLTALRELGLGTALDDFGVGYSSLSHLRQLAITTLKIHQSFVQQLTSRPDDVAICSSIIDLARALGFDTVAEGVETPEQRAVLHSIGCTTGQGYLWSEALPADALTGLLRELPNGFGTARQAAFRDGSPRHRAAGYEHGSLRIAQLHREGASLATIAAALNAEGYRTPAGLRWHPSRVARELSRPGLGGADRRADAARHV